MSALVFDNGSGFTKAGIAGDQAPKVTFPSVVGVPSQPEVPDQKDCYVGNEAQAKRDVLKLNHPIQRGFIKDWDDMEKIWSHTYKELKLSSEEHSLLLTEAPLTPNADRQKMVQIMFEKFNVPSMSLGIQAVLALYAAGRTDGLVLDSGYGVTHIVPCAKGFAIPNAIFRLDLAGSDLTNYLAKMLNERGCTASECNSACILKEKLGYVALDYEKELTKPDSEIQRKYKLPDGTVITLGKEQFQCPEALFKPQLAGMQSAGIHTQISESILKCAEDQRNTLYGNIVLASGNTMFQGTGERLEKELSALAPKSTTVKVITPQDRNHTVWIGGSILAALPAFKELLISKLAYEETGPSIANRIE